MRIYKRLFGEEREREKGAVAVISIDYSVVRLFVFFCLLLVEMHLHLLLHLLLVLNLPVLSVHPCDCDLFILFSSSLFPECALLLLPRFNPLIESVSHLPLAHTLTAVALAISTAGTRFSYFT